MPGPGPSRQGTAEAGAGGTLRRSFVVVALATSLPFLLLVGYLGWAQVSGERERVERDALAKATLLSAQVEKHLTSRLEALGGTATVLGAGAVTAASAEAQARRLKQAFADIERVLVLDELGVALAGAPPVPEGRRIAVGDQEWFKRAATSTEPLVGAPASVGAQVVVALYAPVRTAEGQLRAVMAVDLSLRRVQELLAQATPAGGPVAALVTDHGVVAARQPPLFLMKSVAEIPSYAALVARGDGTGEVVFEDGEARLTGAARVRPAGWILAVGMPAADVLSATRQRALAVGGAALALTILAVAVAGRIATRQAEALARLRLAMSRLASGDLPASLPLTVSGEAGALTESFNRTVSWLRGKLREYEVVTEVNEAADQVAKGDRSVDAILPGLLRRVVAGIGADVGVLVLQEDGDLVARAAVGLPGLGVEGTPTRRGQGLSGAVLASGAAIVLPDIEAEYRVDEPYLRAGGVRSVAALPLVAGDAVLGVVMAGYRSRHTFPPEEVQRLEAIVRRTGQAIERARAVDLVQRSTQGLEARLAEQMEALQQAAAQQREAQRQAQEASRKALELEQRMKLQAAAPPQVREVIVEREVVRADPAVERMRAEMQKTVSEELRAPLSALLDLPRLLVDGLQKPLGDAERGQLEILQERGQEILELIEGLSALSGLQGGRTKLTRAPVDLPGLVQRVVRALQPRAAAKGNRIEVDLKPGIGPVAADARRFEQVLSNLILSAVKYTEVGEIRVTGYQRDRDVVITVADDGVGFTPEEQARVFEPFLPVGPRGGRKLPGTGLLLTVAERLVTAMGGTIRVESEPDRGTWITVTLPAKSEA